MFNYLSTLSLRFNSVESYIYVIFWDEVESAIAGFISLVITTLKFPAAYKRVKYNKRNFHYSCLFTIYAI